MKADALSPYAQPSIADNLTIRVALRLKLPVPKDIEDAFKAATGGAAKPATPAKKDNVLSKIIEYTSLFYNGVY